MLTTELYDYQDKTANDIFNRMYNSEIKGAYLGFETGTGKTLTALSVGDRLIDNKLINSIVVICPVSKVEDWKQDIIKELPRREISTFVTSFQSAWREKNANIIKNVIDSKTLLIVDEGHKMKTYDSKQSKFIQNMVSEHSPYVLVLSATSQNKKYIDLYPQYKILDSKIFNIKAKDFKQNYCIEEANFNMVYAGRSRFPYNEIVGYKHTAEMDAEILKYTYYKKYESKYDRPIEIKQVFKMTSDMKYFKEKKVWPKMDEKALETILKTGDIEDMDTEFIIANRPTLHHIYMRESCSGFIADKTLKDNPKLQWLDDFLDGNEGRIVIFTNFIKEVQLIKELCEKKKRHYSVYDGSCKDLTEWHRYDDCIAIVNVQSGSAGINDFVSTNIAIFFSPPENYIDFEQSKGRIDRIGQTKQPVYYYLQVAGSVEPMIYSSLKDGKNFDQHLFDAWLEEGGK